MSVTEDHVTSGRSLPASGPDASPSRDAAAGPDAGGVPDPGTDPVERIWRQLLTWKAAAVTALEHELGARHGLGVSDYEVLSRLAETEAEAGAEHGARVQDLAAAVHLSQSALSRLADRLAAQGLVCRLTCEADRRGVYIQLTEEGLRRYTDAAPTHRDVLRRTFRTVIASGGGVPAFAAPGLLGDE